MKNLFVFFLSVFFVACEDPYVLDLSEPPGTTQDNLDMSDDRGTAIGHVSGRYGGNSLVWSKATNEVFFFDNMIGGIVIKGTDASTRATREVAHKRCYCDDQNMQISQDGSTVFYTLSDTAGQHCFYETSLIDSHDTTIAKGVVKFTVSSDTRYVAYATNAYPSFTDQIYLYDHRTNLKRYLGQGTPCIFSPTSDQLLIARDSIYLIINIADESIQTLGKLPTGRKYIWDASGLRCLTTTYENFPSPTSHLLILNLNPYTVISSVNVPANMNDYYLAWSTDGKKAAVWSCNCLMYSGSFLNSNCAAQEYTVYALDATSQKISRVAFVCTSSNSDIPSALTFSPDGLKIAYICGQTIYLK